MAQFSRPVLDVTRSNVVEDDDTITALFDQINESIADNNTYIRSILNPVAAVAVFKLSPVPDPELSTGHIFRYNYGKDASGGDAIDITVQLRQGYVSEGALGTLIKEVLHANSAISWAAGATTLSAGEADSITNYADLFIRFIFNTP